MVTKAKVNFQTPLGRARYAWLTTPDTAFDKDGVYQTQLIIDANDAAGMMTLLEEASQQFHGNAPNVRLPIVTDSDTGDVIFKLKSQYKPKFYDSQGNVIIDSQVPALFGGSRIRIGGVITGYDSPKTGKGITMNINKVQIVEANTSIGDDDGGFDAIEGGYVAGGEEDTFYAPTQEDTPQETAAKF
jgi:hypothetical protein